MSIENRRPRAVIFRLLKVDFLARAAAAIITNCCLFMKKKSCLHKKMPEYLMKKMSVPIICTQKQRVLALEHVHFLVLQKRQFSDEFSKETFKIQWSLVIGKHFESPILKLR